MTDYDLPKPELGVWPTAPGVMVVAEFDAEERAKLAVAQVDPRDEVRKEISVGLLGLLHLDGVDPRCVHVVDRGLDAVTDVHTYSAAFHPDPTCLAEIRGGPVDGSHVDASVLAHNERGIPVDTLTMQDLGHQANDSMVYVLAGFRNEPPVWVYEAATSS